MTHEERLIALQLISEENVGTRSRQADRALDAQENKSRAAMGLPPL